jgi:inorganic pyrophosphatase
MMEESNAILIIMSLGGFGLAYGLYNVVAVLSVRPKKTEREKDKDGKTGNEETDKLVISNERPAELTQEQVDKLEMISKKIAAGANVFLWSEYVYLFLFIALFSVLIHFVAENKPGQFYTTIAFAVGALTSILCGYIGMMIATSSNHRTAYKA